MMILLDDEYGEVSIHSDSEPTPQSIITNDKLEYEPEVSLHALIDASNLWIFRLTALW